MQDTKIKEVSFTFEVWETETNKRMSVSKIIDLEIIDRLVFAVLPSTNSLIIQTEKAGFKKLLKGIVEAKNGKPSERKFSRAIQEKNLNGITDQFNIEMGSSMKLLDSHQLLTYLKQPENDMEMKRVFDLFVDINAFL